MVELRRSVELKEQGMQDLILDLQGNSGGMLRTAIEMSDEFLSTINLSFTQKAEPSQRKTPTRIKKTYLKRDACNPHRWRISISFEIVSGAVQDWDEALLWDVVPWQGLVNPIPLGDGSAVRMTVQEYFTPSGRCIQKPYEDGVEAYRSERYERIEAGELLSLDSLELPDSLKFYTNIKKREVYGGGGIIPDIFVPIDTTSNSESFRKTLNKGLMNKFAHEFVNDEELQSTVPYRR